MTTAKPAARGSAQFRHEIESLGNPSTRVGHGLSPASGPALGSALGSAERVGDGALHESSPALADHYPREIERPMGVYIHFPWCKSKCPYCDFLSIAADPIPSEAYADSVIAELQRRSAELATRPVTSIFIGGGTPSLWQPQALGRVLDALHQHLRVAEPCEITVEANPSSLDRNRARELAAAGVNRLSVGVQSLRLERLQFLGRLHDPNQARAALAAALEARIPRVSADLIFGLPNQPVDEVARDAEALAGLGIEHVSAYALTIEPGTAFGARARQGRLPTAVDDDVANAFTTVRAELLRLGFEHYEISNYARPGARSRHNVGYWIGQDYLGLGCGAWGTLTEREAAVRYRNTPSPNRYLELTSTWETADLTGAGSGLNQSELETLMPETRLVERLMLGLRLSDGVDIDGAARELGVAGWIEERAVKSAQLLRDGSLERVGTNTRIAPERWLITDSILTRLL